MQYHGFFFTGCAPNGGLGRRGVICTACTACAPSLTYSCKPGKSICSACRKAVFPTTDWRMHTSCLSNCTKHAVRKVKCVVYKCLKSDRASSTARTSPQTHEKVEAR
uniref:Uncharacterized protein n=1 Tax=Eutreptiella gymnastica TaxID=73025 RepID=A0A7S1I3Z5_9EUGL